MSYIFIFLRCFLSSLIFVSGFLFCTPVFAEDEPVIAIIIDDLGWRKQDDLQALELPGAITYSVLPQTPNATLMANTAASKGKEVLLHIPMEATVDNHLLGPGALTSQMTRAEFLETLEENLQSVPHAIGVNNHMGSLLTEHELSMHRLMDALHRQGNLFFIDSKTTDTALPLETARLYGVANTRRDIFLDHEQRPQFIIEQFDKLIHIAREKGSALGIAHPHPETVETLDYLLAHLKDYGVKLITISEFIKLRNREAYLWRVSSYH